MAVASGTVRISGPDKITKERRNSFQMFTNVIIAIAPNIGRDKGTASEINNWMVLAPSIFPESKSSSGIFWIQH